MNKRLFAGRRAIFLVSFLSSKDWMLATKFQLYSMHTVFAIHMVFI